MEIKIQENRLNDIINKQFETMFDVNNINWTMIDDDYGNETDDAAVFYLGDYGDEEELFRWYGENYWVNNDNEPTNFYNIMVEKSPILEFENQNQKELLDNMFGDRWEKPFKIWFDKHFDIKIKTIE
jgi:hypothetical protein